MEHLITIGIQKTIRIGGQSQSSLLEGHNLQQVSQTEAKTRAERYSLAKHFQALDVQETRIKGLLGRLLHRGKRDIWPHLQRYLSKRHPQIHAQFTQSHVEGFEIVGRHPFELWISAGTSVTAPGSTDEIELVTENLNVVLRKAEMDVHSLSHGERRSVVALWSREVHDNDQDDLFENLKETEFIQKQITNIHDEVDRRGFTGCPRHRHHDNWLG